MPVHPFCVTVYCTTIVPAPIEVSVLPLIVPGPETILNNPPDGVPVSVRVVPLHMGALLLVMMGTGVWFTTIL